MLEEWRLNQEIRKLQKEKSETDRFYAEKHKEAVAKQDSESARQIVAELNFERGMIQAEIDGLITKYLTNQAEQLLLSQPDNELGKPDMWERTDVTDRLVLTRAGIKMLRESIHDEIKKRWERKVVWLQPLSILVSLFIGAGGLAVAILTLLSKSR
jgi:hypothetical protein